jgi:hypothetical protein
MAEVGGEQLAELRNGALLGHSDNFVEVAKVENANFH